MTCLNRGLTAVALVVLAATSLFVRTQVVAVANPNNPYYKNGNVTLCGSGWEKASQDPIKWQYNGSAWSNHPNYTASVWTALVNWQDNTTIDFTAGSNLNFYLINNSSYTWYGARTAQTGGLIGNTCYIVTQKIELNRFKLDSHSDPSKTNTAAHEIGHATGLRHIDDVPLEEGDCDPDSIMLSNKSLRFNSSCQWLGPQSVDVYNTAVTYR